MVKLWAFYSDDVSAIDGMVYINPLLVTCVRGNGGDGGRSLVDMMIGWYVVMGEPEDVAKKIYDALEGL